jgi:hypothetical protein
MAQQLHYPGGTGNQQPMFQLADDDPVSQTLNFQKNEVAVLSSFGIFLHRLTLSSTIFLQMCIDHAIVNRFGRPI